MQRYLKRMAPSDPDRGFTQGKVYKYTGRYINNDIGGQSRPKIGLIGDKYYWVECDKDGWYIPLPSSPAGRIDPFPPETTIVSQDKCTRKHFHELNELYNQTKEGETMVTIEKPTLINGQNADYQPIEAIIEMIKQEEDRIENLKSVKSKSKAIDKLKEKHEQNIKDLIEILDQRD